MEQISLCAYPDIPKGPAKLVEQFDEGLSKTLDCLAIALEEFSLFGIAAPHLNRQQAAFAINEGQFFDEIQYFINPKILWQKGHENCVTECLYFPYTETVIKRPLELEIEYFDRNNTPQRLHAKDNLAIIISYLMDCLEGKIILNYMSPVKRKRFLDKYLKNLSQQHHCGHDCTHEHH